MFSKRDFDFMLTVLFAFGVCVGFFIVAVAVAVLR